MGIDLEGLWETSVLGAQGGTTLSVLGHSLQCVCVCVCLSIWRFTPQTTQLFASFPPAPSSCREGWTLFQTPCQAEDLPSAWPLHEGSALLAWQDTTGICIRVLPW